MSFVCYSVLRVSVVRKFSISNEGSDKVSAASLVPDSSISLEDLRLTIFYYNTLHLKVTLVYVEYMVLYFVTLGVWQDTSRESCQMLHSNTHINTNNKIIDFMENRTKCHYLCEKAYLLFLVGQTMAEAAKRPKKTLLEEEKENYQAKDWTGVNPEPAFACW